MSNKIESVQVFGSGCPTCKKLFEQTKQAVAGLNLGIEVEYSDDIQKIMSLGVMSSPVLVINNKVILAGQLPGLEKIKEIIAAEHKSAPKEEGGHCSCGGKC
ncbi:MAG: thioredoxin family protein [Patescibacteria group bacterium]|jgi:small redox-active disulfide protein 2